MGLFGRGRKGRWRTIREGYQDLPRQEWTEDEHEHWWQTCPEEDYWAEWEQWSRQTVRHHRVKTVRREVLDMAREAARETDARAIEAAGGALRDDGGPAGAEFAALLRVEGDTIEELVLLPGTVSGDEHAIFDFLMQPVDMEVRGTLHSHPDEHPYPSDADFELFGAHGEVHLILCRPYGPDDWRAYDHTGQPIRLDVAPAR